MKEVVVSEITGNTLAVSALDGEVIFNDIVSAFKNNEQITINFEGIELTITAFLNASIGKLYSTYSSDEIKKYLKIVNLNQDEVELLRFVIEKAKLRFGKESIEDEDLN